MKRPAIPFFLLSILGVVLLSCNHNGKMMQDTKKVFAEQSRIEIPPSAMEALIRLKALIFDNIDVLIPFEEEAVLNTPVQKDGTTNTLSYEKVGRCRKIPPSRLRAFLEVLPEAALENHESDVSEFTTAFSTLRVCNLRPGSPPSLEIFLFAKSIKGEYSYHYIDHRIGVNMDWESEYEIESIESGLVKLDTLADNIVYRIFVSPDIGMLD